MLKACWDCIGGYDLIGDQRPNEDSRSIHLNGAGGTQGPPWQSVHNGKMFPTPTLTAGNQIIIKGQMTNDRRLNIAISTSYSTVCEINVANRPNDNENEDFLKISSHGNEVYNKEANLSFNDGKNRTGTQYLFRFEVNSNGSMIDVFAGIEEGESDQYLESIAADVNNIRMISADGQVQKLAFIFN